MRKVRIRLQLVRTTELAADYVVPWVIAAIPVAAALLASGGQRVLRP